jgi:hypothetical protein
VIGASEEEDSMTRHFGTRRWLAVAALVALLALIAACGGGKASRGASTTGGGGDVARYAPPGGDSSKSTTEQQLAAPAVRDAQAAQQPAAGTLAAAPDASGGASGSGTAPALPSQLDRKMIVVATVNLTLDDVARGFEDVGNIAAVEGGFISSSAFGHNGDRQTASLTIRVPVDKYQDAMTRIRKLSDKREENVNSSDVTEEYTDLESRLRNLQATEAIYLKFLDRAGDLGQVLTVQDRINATRAEIEQVQGRINLVEHQTDLATITVHLDPPVVAPDQPKAKSGGARSPLEAAADSFAASIVVLKGIATVGLAVAAFSWWLLPLAAGGLFLGRRQLARDRRPPAGTPAGN